MYFWRSCGPIATKPGCPVSADYRAGVAAEDSGELRARPAAASGYSATAGLRTLFYKEVLRFHKVMTQTVAAPVLTSLLYLLVFSHLMEGRARVYPEISYTSFLVPGLVMMSVLQNAFANSSSSLIQSKITGNIIFVLLPPLAYWEFFCGYVLAAVVRGLAVGLGVLLVTVPFADLSLAHPAWILAFAFGGSALLGALGLIAGIVADKIDQVAAFQNFLIMPLTFLSGVFYSIHSLPPAWQTLSHFNPFFYMIDGLRYGFFGVADVDPTLSLAVAAISLALVSGTALAMLRSGYKLRY
jgi:ABC-2 type transport system permease protein